MKLEDMGLGDIITDEEYAANTPMPELTLAILRALTGGPSSLVRGGSLPEIVFNDANYIDEAAEIRPMGGGDM